MGKAPADQFYFGDYIRDTRCLSIAARGAWADILCFAFFETPQGRISLDLDAWSRMFGTDSDTAKSLLTEIQKRKVGDVETERNGDITVTNRRKYREWIEREGNKTRQKRYRERHSGEADSVPLRKNNDDVTSLSSSSSSTSSSTSDDLTDSYVHACVRAGPERDARLVEIAVLETLQRRRGSPNGSKPIRSPEKYFEAEIAAFIEGVEREKLSSGTIDTVLKLRRQQAGKGG